jgi:hypothetical protein
MYSVDISLKILINSFKHEGLRLREVLILELVDIVSSLLQKHQIILSL